VKSKRLSYSPANRLSEELIVYGQKLFVKFPDGLKEERWTRNPSDEYTVMQTQKLNLPTLGKYPIAVYFCTRYDTRNGTYDVVLSRDPFDMAANMQNGEPKFTEKFRKLTLEDVKKNLHVGIVERFQASFL